VESEVVGSLFAHEKAALEKISQRIESLHLGETLCNLELHDAQSNRYFETDLVLIAEYGIYIIELKHWSGTIEVLPNTWIQNRSFYKRDPHKANNFKAKLLKGIFERKYPHFPSLYFESVVVFTNPEINAHGCTNPKKATHLPTFENIDQLLEYIKIESQHKTKALNIGQSQKFSNYLEKLNSTSTPRDFVFPGYEIVERLYQYEDRAEVVARRTDLRHRRLSRMRIFFPGTGDQETRRRAHERATATLNAVAIIGDYPNILKVVDVPNENNYIVESSDWSETGTLRDVLNQKVLLKPTEAIEVILGIARGLEVAHTKYVVHRALSPENVLMVDGIPKLMNFDLSYQLEEDRVTVIPDTTKIKRTPYIAPEVLVGGTIPEASADLFSLGVIFYEMLVGETPFKCSIDLEQSGGQLSEDKYKKLVAVEEIPQSVTDLIFKLIQLHRSDRSGDDKSVINILSPDSSIVLPQYKDTNPILNVGDQSYYRISEFICEGSESQIYKAEGLQGHLVALKLFNIDVPLARIRNEVGTTSAIRHLSIVKLDNHNQWTDGRYYIAFDWISTESLRDKIKNGERPNVNEFMSGTEQLLDALDHLHQNSEEGIDECTLHNDVKPDNILIGKGNRFILIDFGIASNPHIGTYSGTEGYVAPDLKLGEDREYSINGDLYSVSVCLFEWLTGEYPSRVITREEGEKGRLVQVLEKGFSGDAQNRYQSAPQMWEALREALIIPKISEIVEIDEIEEIVQDEKLEPVPADIEVPWDSIDDVEPNPFVTYLNSLQSTDAASENSLAEFQATNTHFKDIHVRHPITKYIQTILADTENRHVILSGNAGDGKSTIAIEIFKQLNGIAHDQTLETSLKSREDVKYGNTTISLIKDFSEWSPSGRAEIMQELLGANGPRFLLVSNTGTLLDAFRKHATAHDSNWFEIESNLLNEMDKSEPEDMDYQGTIFRIINVAKMDNLRIGEQIFDRMLADEQWKSCALADCHKSCPIFRNFTLIKANQSTIRERIFLAYRRMYEYGTRLTLRQLSAHLAYTITSGQNYSSLKKMSQRGQPIRMSEFMFFNRYFGDNGFEIDASATQLRGVLAVREQNFGSQLSSVWERNIWLRRRGYSFKLCATDEPDDFEALRQLGVGLEDDSEMASQRARDQVRRTIYFLHDFGINDSGNFQRTFLRSNMILDFKRWQTQDNDSLSLQERSGLERRILQVLQEHFAGVRLPEGHKLDHYIYVTLNRHARNIRQSTQVVLAKYEMDEFKVRLMRSTNPTGEIRRDLVINGPAKRNDLKLHLALPFLDFVMQRNRGEIGKELQTSFVDRLERFKGQLIPDLTDSNEEGITLIRLHGNHTFQRQIFTVRNERLEVIDA
jgi:serine/threonine protein kinase